MQAYTNTDQRLHHLSQLIAKANRTFLPAKEDDSHTNLYVDGIGHRISGRWIATAENKKRFLTLHLANFRFEWLDETLQTLQVIDTYHKTLEAVEQAMCNGLSDVGLEAEGFLEALHFAIPAYDFADEPIAVPNAAACQQWLHYRSLANEMCAALGGYLQIPSEARLWPHHFDTGFYGVVNDIMGIGFGLAMKDDMVGAPYFYMTGYPVSGELVYHNMPALHVGQWITDEVWKGAVLSLSELNKMEYSQRTKAVATYIKQAANWFLHPTNRNYTL